MNIGVNEILPFIEERFVQISGQSISTTIPHIERGFMPAFSVYLPCLKSQFSHCRVERDYFYFTMIKKPFQNMMPRFSFSCLNYNFRL